MSAGRGSRKNRQSAADEVTLPSASPSQRCTYAERICQRPISNPTNNLCWAHSKACEKPATGGKSRKTSLSATQTSAVQQSSLEAASSVKEPSDMEKLRRLTATYVSANTDEVSNNNQDESNTVADTVSGRYDYLETIGSINVDDPAAPFVAMEDSASDDGSDEFASTAPLSHAGVFSAEEIVSMACDRMQRLKRLYVEELKQIGVQLKLSRRRYLTEVSRDRRRRIGDPLVDYVAVTPEQQQSRRIFQAMRRHRRRYPSPDNVLRWSLRTKLRQQKQQSTLTTKTDAASSHNGDQQQTQSQQPQQLQVSTPPNINRHCSVASCDENILPLTKYCTKHILLDRRQLLFAKCPGFVIDESVEKSEEQLTMPNGTNLPSSTPTRATPSKPRLIECGRLAVQAPSLPRGLASTSPPTSSVNTGRTGNSPSPSLTSSSSALCSTHRCLIKMSTSSSPKTTK